MTLATSLVLVASLGQPAAAQTPPKEVAGIRVFPGDVSVCPTGDSDCHLTLVDSVLCNFLAQLLDPASENWTDSYNCTNTEEGVYVCLNILAARRIDAEIGTDYTYPYLLELAADYEVQLDRCLPSWSKSRSIENVGQSISYGRKDNIVALAILPFERSGKRYDRLTLQVRVRTK